jgi:uncharacterized membrane protein (DUF441 family)
MTISDLDVSYFVTRSIIFAPIILGIVQALKMSDIPDKYAPIISIFVGVIIAFITNEATLWGQNILSGLVYGLSASGLYSGTKSVMQQRKKGDGDH